MNATALGGPAPRDPALQDPVLCVPAVRWVWGYATAILSVLLAGGLLIGASISEQGMGWGGRSFLALMSGALFALARYVWRDASAKRQLLMQASTEGLRLHLPPARSLTHRVAWETHNFGWSEIEAFETRLEAYSSLGMANMQRTFALRRRSGGVIFLGEDRARGTNLQSHSLATFVTLVSERFGIPIIDRGMAEGSAGILGAFFTAAPPWQSDDLSTERKALLWRRVGRTGLIVVVVPLVALVLALLFGP